jgi:hypothetical protein
VRLPGARSLGGSEKRTHLPFPWALIGRFPQAGIPLQAAPSGRVSSSDRENRIGCTA